MRSAPSRSGESCEKPVETCLQLGLNAEYSVELGLGRPISEEEAKELIKNSDKAGLVLQPANNQNAGTICSCCGDCCAMLRALKKQPVPSASVKSNYYAAVDVEN